MDFLDFLVICINRLNTKLSCLSLNTFQTFKLLSCFALFWFLSKFCIFVFKLVKIEIEISGHKLKNSQFKYFRDNNINKLELRSYRAIGYNIEEYIIHIPRPWTLVYYLRNFELPVIRTTYSRILITWKLIVFRVLHMVGISCGNGIGRNINFLCSVVIKSSLNI